MNQSSSLGIDLENLVMFDIVSRLSEHQSFELITECARNTYSDVAALSNNSVRSKEIEQLDGKLKEIFIADQTRHRMLLAQQTLLE